MIEKHVKIKRGDLVYYVDKTYSQDFTSWTDLELTSISNVVVNVCTQDLLKVRWSLDHVFDNFLGISE